MGVTIHFEGQLKSNADYDKVMMTAKMAKAYIHT